MTTLPALPPQEVPDDPGLADELVALLARQGRRVPIPVFLCALLQAAMAAGAVGGWWPWLWLGLVTAVLVLRWQVLGRLPSLQRLQPAQKLRIAVLLSALNGVVHGASLAFAPALSEPERAVQTILLLGLCAGSVATTGGYRPAFVAFVVPTLLPLSAVWALGAAGTPQRWVDLSMAGLTLLFGGVLLALARDAFGLLKTSFEIRQQQADLNRQLRAALGAAEAANRAKTRFLASASHDLRQPMHTLSLFGAALTMRPLDAASRQIAQQMNVALQSLGAQLDSLLDVSKLDAGIVAVRPSSFSLADFLQQIDSDCRPAAQAKGLALEVQCPADAVCTSDELLLGRILRNLVDNAIKYTLAGTVSLRVDRVDGLDGPAGPAAAHWRLRVQDTGCGIPPAEQERVFEEFYQLDNPERDRSRGLGLGLAIVRRLASLLGVAMTMHSQPGRGTVFELHLPRGPRSPPPAALAPIGLPPPPLAGLQVLVIDDEAGVRQGMQTLLLAHGCQVSLAGSTDEALRLAAACRPAMVLADLRLRGDESGIAAIHRLRRAQGHLPALLISGDTAPERLQEAHAAGIPLLHKPVTADALLAAISQALPAAAAG